MEDEVKKPPPRKRAAAPKGVRTILVTLNDGRRVKVDNIPATAKITFGPVSPGSRDYNSGNALRIYTSQQNQLAVFTGVREFRDASLVLMSEMVSRVEGKSQKSGSTERVASSESRESRVWEREEF